MELQIALNAVATQNFRRQADFDYISARANYRMQFGLQFLWSASQAVEKYLKAILLFNGISAKSYIEDGKTKDFGHNLPALLKEIRDSLQFIEFELDDEEAIYINGLYEFGAGNRYLNASFYFSSDSLLKLDRIVWKIRRYCQAIPDRGIGSKQVVPNLKESFLAYIKSNYYREHPTKFRILDGQLEEIMKRDSFDYAKKSLEWGNFWYGTSSQGREEFFELSYSENKLSDQYLLDPDITTELKKYVK